ncbi:MAG: hypothetical protein JWN40_5314 [Phycisphaerales bacterium]|nr:hypothetical protein [Phycisphaerales bacterium]
MTVDTGAFNSQRRRHGRDARDAAAFLLLLLTTLPAFAQPVPTIKSASPDVLQRGVTTRLTLTGDNLDGATQTLLAGPPGLSTSIHSPAPTTQPIKSLTLDITASPDAQRGPRELRLVTKNGVTKPLLLFIDDLPPIAEKEPNNSPGEAQPITLPAVITGKIQAELDVDCFRFDAKKGQRLIFDVQAFRTGSKLDASLALFDADGRRVAHDEDTNGLDPLIDFTVPANGVYTLRIQDLQYKGGADFSYRIRAGEIPYVDAIFPLGGQRGQEVAVELKGRNLAGTKRMSMALDPADGSNTRQLEAPTAAGMTNSLPFAVSDLPEISEPAGATTKPVALSTIPIIINGKIGKPNETDTYKFTATTAGPVVLEVAAARLGSRLDALLTLMDDKGVILQRNDDIAAPPPAPGAPAAAAAPANADARIQFTAEKDKTYLVSIRDLTDRGGDSYGYRLSIAPPRPATPDFDVTLRAAEPLRLNRGGRTMLWAMVNRKGGFAGDVTVSLWPLPPGVTCRPLRVSATQPTSGLFTLTAAPDAAPGLHPLSVVATASVGDEVITKTLPLDPALHVVPQAYLTIHEPAPFKIERIGPQPTEADPKLAAAKIAALEKTLNTQTPELDAAQAKWEKTFNLANAWEVIDIVSAKASSNAKLVKQPDGSLRAEGRLPNTDKYTVVARISQSSIRAIRLEAIADVGAGPGRAPNGNFVLSTFRVATLPAGSTDSTAGTPLEIASATADFSQAGFDVADSIAAKSTGGWAVSPELGKSHTATYLLKSPALTESNGGTLAFTLDHATIHLQHILGHFRLLVTSSEKPDDNAKISAPILALLKTPAEQRTKEQKESLAAFYRALAPELAKAREELAALKSSGTPFPPVVTAGGAAAKLDILLARSPNFTGDITLTVEGYSAGLDDKSTDPAPFTKNFDFTPITLKPNQSSMALDLRSKPTAEKGTRDAIVRAEVTVGGAKYVIYSQPFPLTVK